jgi:LytS/YehU family sensor histidine kinase
VTPRQFIALSLTCIAASVVVALLDTLMQLLRTPENTFAWVFPRLLLAWLTLGILAPVVILFARRVRFGRTRVAAALTVHALLAMASAAMHYTLLTLVHRLYLHNVEPFWASVRELFLYYAHFDVIAYALIVGFVHAWLSHNEARTRERGALMLRAELSDARLQSLRAQLQPHFLFNALNAVAMLVRARKTEAAIDTIAGLSELLRRVIQEHPAHQVPLRDEIDFARRYLDIERTRFGERLHITIDAPDDTLDVVVPDLILQPLVENAMRHGVARTSRPCRVSIVARRANGHLTVSVSDDAGTLEAGRPASRPGVGLKNTEARLAQIHGDAARLSISSNELGGVTARVVLPASLQPGAPSLRESPG